MEESAKRKERLKAMRMEATQANVSDAETSNASALLSNPLIETSTMVPMPETSCANPRFDFYTDPMSAFSVNKKRNKADNQSRQDFFTSPGPRSDVMTPSHAQQMWTNQRMHQKQGPYDRGTPHRGPRGFATPSLYQGTYIETLNRFRASAGCYSPVPHSSPRGMTSPFPMHQGTSEGWNGAVGRDSYNVPSNTGYAPPHRPGFKYGQQEAHWLGNSAGPGSGHLGSPGPSSGRGRGSWYGGRGSPSFGQSGGRGRGFGLRNLTADGDPKSFYDKSMEEDPWQHLQPVLWMCLDAPASRLKSPVSSNSWLPKSIRTEKPTFSEPSNKSNSGQSLAEYLAASFNEAVSNPPSE